MTPEHLEPCGLTHQQLGQACENVGVDLSCGACAAQFFTGYTLPTSRHDAMIQHHPKCKSTFHHPSLKEVVAEELGLLRKASTAFLKKWGGHCGACCTFDAEGRVIVTRESCKCPDVNRELRDALGEWEPREWEKPNDGVYVGPPEGAPIHHNTPCTESMPCQYTRGGHSYVCPRHR
jgi:hypothetical protein